MASLPNHFKFPLVLWNFIFRHGHCPPEMLLRRNKKPNSQESQNNRVLNFFTYILMCENCLEFLGKPIAAFPTSLNGFLLELQSLFLRKIFWQSVSMLNSVNLNFCFQLFHNFLLHIAFLVYPPVLCFQFQIFVGYCALTTECFSCY